MKQKRLNARTLIPLAMAIVSLVFIVVGLKDYGFWNAQPTPGFFPIIIAVVLLLASGGASPWLAASPIPSPPAPTALPSTR